MKFRTQVELPEKAINIRHSDRILLLGSCFTEYIGGLLSACQFRCDINPFGALYNPLSIATALEQVAAGKHYTVADLFETATGWHSWMHHSAFSGHTAEACLASVNARLEQASEALPETGWLLLTWGSAYAYRLADGRVVGNCHKQPERLFDRRLLTVGEIVHTFVPLLEELRKSSPSLKVLLTVSPIRHIRDGLHGNQLSKSTLLLAADEVCRSVPDCWYFPAYEILIDELRDYRFYADDMFHPSSLAVAYIWECFSKTCFDTETRLAIAEWEGIRKALEHKPFDAQSVAYRNFLTQIVLKMHRLKEKFPYFDLQKELAQCQALLNA